jgi:uncharacterized protein YjiK
MAMLAGCGDGQVRDVVLHDPPRRDLQDSTGQSPQMSRYDLSAPPTFRLKLTGKLKEISGLCVANNGQLLAHDDESGIVYFLSASTGQVMKRFSLGSGFLEEDFEGIAIKKDTIFLVTSDGRILEFLEAGDKGHASFRLYRTGLREKNDVEGLEYDPETNCLLLACKGDPGKGYGGRKAVYAFSLSTRTLEKEPRFLIPVDQSDMRSGKREFHPSGIARHPDSGAFFLVSANGEAVIEIDRTGRILSRSYLPGKIFPQPEGIAFGSDLSMFICNDGQGDDGSLVVYRPQDRGNIP